MKALSYSDQLKHPNWQRKRLEALQASDFKCSECGEAEKMLHVHHKHYVKGRKAWEYDLPELAVLCEACHESAHDIKNGLAEILLKSFHDVPMESFAYGLLGGLVAPFRIIGDQAAGQAFINARASFELGYMLAALGPADLKAAVLRKIEEGRFSAEDPVMKLVLED